MSRDGLIYPYFNSRVSLEVDCRTSLGEVDGQHVPFWEPPPWALATPMSRDSASSESRSSDEEGKTRGGEVDSCPFHGHVFCARYQQSRKRPVFLWPPQDFESKR